MHPCVAIILHSFPVMFKNNSLQGTEKITGIDDLKSGKIVTPLPAKATFLDDPLRVLRAIRFGTCVFFSCFFHHMSLRCPSQILHFAFCGCRFVSPS